MALIRLKIINDNSEAVQELVILVNLKTKDSYEIQTDERGIEDVRVSKDANYTVRLEGAPNFQLFSVANSPNRY